MTKIYCNYFQMVCALLTVTFPYTDSTKVSSGFYNLIDPTENNFDVFINGTNNPPKAKILLDGSTRRYSIFAGPLNITFLLDEFLFDQISLHFISGTETNLSITLSDRIVLESNRNVAENAGNVERWEFSLRDNCTDHIVWLENFVHILCLKKFDNFMLNIKEAYFKKEREVTWWKSFRRVEIVESSNRGISLSEVSIIGRLVNGKACNCFSPGLNNSLLPCERGNSCVCKLGITTKDCFPDCTRGAQVYPPFGPSKQTINLLNTPCLEKYPGYSLYVGEHECLKVDNNLNNYFQNGSSITTVSLSCALAQDLPLRKAQPLKLCWGADWCILLNSQSFYQLPEPIIHSFSPLRNIQSGGTRLLITGQHLDSSINTILDAFFTKEALILTSSNLTDKSKRVCKANSMGDRLTCHTPYMKFRKLIPSLAQKNFFGLRYNLNSSFVPFELCFDPTFERMVPEVQIRSEDEMRVSGTGFLNCLTKDEYSIKVGETEVENFTISANFILFKAPPHIQSLTSDKDGGSKIHIVVGNIDKVVGYVKDGGSLQFPIIAMVFCVIGALLVITFVVLLLCLRSRRKACFKRKEIDVPDVKMVDKRDLVGHLVEPLKSQVERCMVDEKEVEMKEEIGEGHFGKVFKGSLHGSDVAIKILHHSSSKSIKSKLNFLSEAVRMMDLNHQNVLALQAIVIQDLTHPMIVLPYMQHGDLKSYVENDENVFTEGELLELCGQVAAGMTYLASMSIIHRDLAARNCMVDAKKKVKVADFGLARDIYREEYYEAKQSTLMPFKWVALELLDGKKKFSEKTDVWSFGVLTWEVFTEGSMPYFQVRNQHLKTFLEDGHRLEKPATLPDSIYSLMLSCWLQDPTLRPTFSSIKSSIEDYCARNIENQYEYVIY